MRKHLTQKRLKLMAEHTRIATYFAPLTAGESGAFALTDDAAVLAPPPGYAFVFTTDSVIEGIHVLPGATPQQFAQKLVRRNLSDLAAMGATPWRYLVNVHTPRALGDRWFADFAAALAREQTEFGMVLVGGDTTSGGDVIHTTLTCLGLMQGAPLRRSGAHAGDDVYASGTIGDAALGLQLLQRNISAAISEDAAAYLIARYHLPQPRLALGTALQHVAHSCMDISDGLLADAAQIAAASGVELRIMRDAVPLSGAAQPLLQQHPSLWASIVSGGDDYELLFTAPASARETIAALAQSLDLPLTRIGTVTEGEGVALLDTQGAPIAVDAGGWEHG